MSPESARIICFLLIAIMNLSAWIDLQGLFVEIPLIVPFTPERWTLPSIASVFVCAANIVPIIVVLLRSCQGKRFSEIPYIYIIIIVGILACCVIAMFWQKTVILFGRERSVWLLSGIFVLSMLDCTSSLVFFDYMKRFRAEYLRAAFLGEALTAAIPTLLILAQGVGGETICVQTGNGTYAKPTYTQPRFSVRVFMFAIAGIIMSSLIAFILLRWTKLVDIADAEEHVRRPMQNASFSTDRKLNRSYFSIFVEKKPMSGGIFIFLLVLNTIETTIGYGCLPSLSTYALLPFGQRAFYYWSVLTPIAYPLSLLTSLYWKTVSNSNLVFQSIVHLILSSFVFIIAAQSPCPWLADTSTGALMIITVWFIMSFIGGFLRIAIGNRIKREWKNDKGMFYYGATAQLGLFLGTIPTYLLINVFEIFVDRQPCQSYCLT
uniref:Riboflavin transporter n=1 Tax=Philodina roseola TaxID=96448 RepID=B6S354_PHIRO|nr:G protein-coupled receptor-like protein [Philodina roseola]